MSGGTSTVYVTQKFFVLERPGLPRCPKTGFGVPFRTATAGRRGKKF